MPNITPYAVMAIFILFLAFFFIAYFRRREELPSPEAFELPVRLGFPKRLHRMERSDVLPLALITILYAIVGYWGLGDTDAPDSYLTFEQGGASVELEFKEPVSISSFMYFSGVYTNSYSPEVSADGENWTSPGEMGQKYSDVLRWNKYPEDSESSFPEEPVRFLRITAGSKLDLAELAIYDANGLLISPDRIIIPPEAAPLFDEQELIPEKYTFENSTYFDEIYHARTAYEHILGIWPYEISHPPLGKLIISLGISAFGLNPFGWRFMGTLFGVLMLPALYIFLKNMFGKTFIAALGTTLLAADFMHFVQTRISTIDTYAVIFIMLMYLFMYRFVTTDYDDPFLPKYKPLLNLFLSGLCFGLGAASKWVVIYGVAGLALMWLLFWIFRGRDMIAVGRGGHFARSLLANIAWCVLFFIVVPCAIYYVSYYQYGIGKGLSGGLKMLFEREYFDIVISNQKFMFTYHRDVESSHPYASTWYMWLVNARPILYYLDWADPKSAFSAFLNPIICWGGLVAMVAMGIRTFKNRDGRALFILIGYLSQLVPWILVPRETFAYHYFPSLIFLILALCHVFDTMGRRDPVMWKKWVCSYAALAVLLFIMFYPALTGIYVPRFYTDTFLKWFGSAWPV